MLFVFLSLQAQDKKSYKIDIKIKGLEDSVLYLANYYGDKTYVVDTAIKKGKYAYSFEAKKHLEGGIYIVIGSHNNSIFEFLIADNQDLKFDSDQDNLIEKMKVKGSNENALFFDYLAYSNIQFTQLKRYQKKLKTFSPPNDSIAIINKLIEQLNLEVADYKEAIIEAYPNTFIAHFFLAMKSPDLQFLPNFTKQDSAKAFKIYKKKYWDYMDFNDERLIRTPVFHNKLDYYFKAIANPQPDSLIKDIDHFLSLIPEKSELYKHSLWYLTLKFDQSNRMGYDKILVHFADTYYSKGKANWLNPTVLNNIIDEANKRRNALIGNKASNLVMQNADLSPVSMYAIDKKYTILYFWNPNCSHCTIETPKLRDFYLKYAKKFNLEVYAVCADANLKEMKNYMAKHKLTWINVNGSLSYTQDFHELYNVYSTPYIFVLDKDKTIIAKQINSDQLFDFISNYDKIKTKNDIQLRSNH
ncbi:MAG: redoxin domain-containing protein [Bacteroidales bacterium]|nr:redoxin domain-containing protein [Bacteroidales bacterium]